MRQAKQLRLAYLTSCRELLRDEQVGPCAAAPVSGYRASLLESLISAVSSPSLDALLSLVLVLFDDDPAEISDRTAALTLFGDAGAPPVSLPSPAVERVSSLAFRVSPSAPQERHSEAKAQIDQAILRALIRYSVDVLLCDSYMLVFGDSFLRGFPNLALNIHPGITAETDPGWCKGATPTRDALTRALHGWIIIDDKPHVPYPQGELGEVEYEGRRRQIVRLPGKLGRSGVSVHRIIKEVDAGPVLASAAYNFSENGITAETIRTWNYALKLPLTLTALRALHASAGGIIFDTLGRKVRLGPTPEMDKL
jgi:folate-dependent phosphoribosylglycinamide formyltransferase PurN